MHGSAAVEAGRSTRGEGLGSVRLFFDPWNMPDGDGVTRDAEANILVSLPALPEPEASCTVAKESHFLSVPPGP